MLTYRGFLKTKGHTVKVSEKFRKRELVITDNAQSYPQYILFQLTQDRCELLDKAEVGQEVEVHFLLRGHKWKNPQGEIKIFNSLDVFRIEVLADEHNFSNETLVPTPDDDLPF